jgi:hypothetical protein
MIYLYYGYKTKAKFLTYEEYEYARDSYLYYQIQQGYMTEENYNRFKVKFDNFFNLMKNALAESEDVKNAVDGLVMLSQ